MRRWMLFLIGAAIVAIYVITQTSDLDEPIELTISSGKRSDERLKFRIPGSYLALTRNLLGGEQKYLRVEVQLPDLIPTKLADRSARDFWPNTVRLSLFTLPYSSKRYFGLVTHESRREEDADFGLAHYTRLHCPSDGTKALSEKVPRHNGCVASDQELFIGKLGDEPRYLIAECANNCLACKCSVSVEFNGYLLKYGLSRNYLADWRGVNDKLVGTISSFLVKR